MSEITRLIESQQAEAGVDTEALFAAAYPELRRLAHARLSGSAALTQLQTTALVHESWLRLSGQDSLKVASRPQFFAYAAKVMRSVIVDQLRESHAARRGGGERPLPLETELGDGLIQDDEALQVHEALASLAQVEPRLAQVVEMRYFAGLTEAEIGAVLGLTERTVRRDWEKARLLLASMLR